MDVWNPAFGRIVIFINPGYILKNSIIPSLLEMEFEVYYIEEPRYTKTLLRQFPNSICFFDIDSGMSVDEYMHLLLSIENDPDFVNVLVGVISRETGIVQRNFMLNVRLSAGFLPRTGNKDEMLYTIARVLKLNDAKGRRQYVRISIPEGSEATFTCLMNSRQMNFPVKDISTCGFACTSNGQPESFFMLNSVIHGKLVLDQVILPCTAVLYAIKPMDKSLTLVMLFAGKGNTWSLKKNIKAFSSILLQKDVAGICSRGGLDSSDYSKPPDKAATFEAMAELEEFEDDGFYADDEHPSGLNYTHITSPK